MVAPGFDQHRQRSELVDQPRAPLTELGRLRAVRETGADRQPEQESTIIVSDDAASLHPDDVLATEHAAQHKITRRDHSPGHAAP